MSADAQPLPHSSASKLSSAIDAAWNVRAAFHVDSETNCYRIFHGYSEGFPGLSIDRYGPCAIINKKAEVPLPDTELATVLTTLFPFDKIVLKSHQRVDAARGNRVSYLKGDASPHPLKVKEHGVFYFVDLNYLHSNGLFLDARPARRWIRNNAQSRRICNLFAHMGSLGVAAMVGGAKEVVHIDKSQDALDKIRINYEFNSLRQDARAIVQGDLYYHLPRAIKWRQKFQGIILDPPPFLLSTVRVPDHKPSGQDFGALIKIVCQLLDPGGWLICIFHDFQKSHDECDAEIVRASNRTLTATWRDRADQDFPETDPNRLTRMSAFMKSL